MSSASPASSSSLEAISDLLLRGDTESMPSKDLSMSIGMCCRKLEEEALPDADFASFLSRIHDHIVTKDSAIRSVLLRAIRYGMRTPAACDAIIDNGVHFLVIVSLEKDAELSWERMQALKLIKKFLDLSPEKLPLGFARSLVAIASEKNDNFRRVSLETLRQIGASNAKIACDSGAFRVLFDAVLDPSTSHLAECILMTVMHLLNSPATRKYVRPHLDLQCLLTPFTDLDSSRGDEFLKRLELAKRALVRMMRAWAGVVELTADAMALPAIVKLLSDPKISAHVKEAVLDCIAEIFEPVINKLEFRKAHGSSHVVKQSQAPRNEASSSPSPSFQGQTRDRRSTITPPSTSKREVVRSRSNTESSAIRSQTSTDEADSFAGLRQNSISAIINDSGDAADTLSPLKSLRHESDVSSAIGGSQSRQGGRGKRLSMWTRFTTHAELAEKISVDPIYNMLDNYAGILCSSFIHVHLFDHLCWLCANGDMYTSARCRDMIVDLMGVVSKVCTESVCSELLTLPCLIEDAASASSIQHPDKAYKASDLLMALSDAFSVNKSDGSFARSSSEYSSERASHNSSSSVSSLRHTKRLSARSLEAGMSSHKEMSAARSLSNISDELVQTSLVSGTDISSKKGEMAHDLKAFMNTAVDRSEFSRQMDMSRILGKEGKEPFRWDWSVVNELLDYSLRNSDRLVEALKTKFVKRISGFYRCSVEEKGYFSNLEWEPNHIHFLECACNLYSILVESDAGTTFLNSDRRGMVFAEIVRDLEAVITSAAAMKAANQGVGYASYNLSGSGKSGGLNVFRPSGCVHTMAREYFCLIGRLSHTPQGRQVLNSCQTYDHLSRLGHYVSLDYLSRVALTALGFTDGGFMSKDLLQIYTTSGATSDNLRLYCHTLLRALLRSRSKEFCEWGMGLMVEQLIFPHVPRKSIIRCLEEAAQDREYLRELISKEPDVVGEDMCNLLVRFLALPEGFRYLNGLDWIAPQLEMWQSRKCEEYAKQVELSLARGLNSTILQRQQSHNVSPIPVPARAFSRHPAAPSGLQYPDGGVDMEGFLRIPWNIEVKLSGPSILQPSESDFVKLDTFLDSSDLGCPASNDMTSDSLRLVKVRGIVMDSKGMPSGYAVMNDKTILSTLLCGVCPVTKAGTVLSSSDTESSLGNVANALGDTEVRTTYHHHHSIHRRKKSVVGPKSTYSAPDLLGMRASMSDLPTDGTSGIDVPVSMLSGGMQEWVKCKPSHRQKSRQISLSADNERFAVEVPGEPVVFIFNRYPPNMKPSDKQSSRYNPNAPVAYLVEVHYILRLQTGQSAFLPLPRHMYGELARTPQGLKLLNVHNVIVDLLESVKKMGNSSSRVISGLWALGHIASTENGFKSVIHCDPDFVSWCIDTATTSGTYSVRACAFTVLGLMSRTENGSHRLNACNWECAPIHYVAVAVPRDPSVLFHTVAESAPSLRASSGDEESRASAATPPAETANSGRSSRFIERTCSSFMGDGFDGVDADTASKILQCIGKLPGQILYKDSFAALMKFHENSPEVFNSRALYLAAHEILAQYSYKLSLRRMILSLFPLSAKKQDIA